MVTPDFCTSRRFSVDPLYLSFRITISTRKEAITTKGGKHHGALPGSRCLHRRSFGNVGEKPTRPQRTCEGTSAEAWRSVGRLLLLFWRVRCRCAQRTPRSQPFHTTTAATA